jgi:hypothetical protein
MAVPIDLSAVEAVFLFVVLSLSIGILNAVGQDIWSWLMGRLSRRGDRA